MSTEYVFKCSKCDYQISISLGVGFLFPRVYKETVERAKSGEFGETIRDFLNTFPEGRIDAEPALYICQECGNMEVLPELSMYLPKGELPERDNNILWSVVFPFKGESYVTHMDLENDYDIFEEYKHKCSKCQRNYTLILKEEILSNGLIKCPRCKVDLDLIEFGRGD